MKALSALPEDWAIAREADGWQIADLSGGCYDCGSSYRWIGSGKTISAAIKAAHATIAREEQEAEARQADYERRKAAGKLTPMEEMNELTTALWAKTSAQLFERPWPATGDTIRVFNHAYEAVK